MKRLRIKGAVLGMTLLISAPSVLAADYQNHWAKEAIEKWRSYEVIKGYENGDFRPNAPITRGELAALLDRIFKFPEVEGAGLYMDIIAAPNKWYVAPVNKVTALGLMHIEGFLFEPNAPVTREEAAYAICKAYELTGMGEKEVHFKDEAQLSTWAVEAVNTLASHQYMNGTPEGYLMPQGTLTRAEVVTLLENITGTLITQSGTYTQSVKGSVVVSSPEIILKDLTIEGNLYLTSGVKKSTLENVTVTGIVYINGGSTQIGGNYQEVRLAAGTPIEMTAGHIEKLVVTKAGSSLKVGKEATIGDIVQKSPIEIEGVGTIGGIGSTGGAGGAGGGQISPGEAPRLQAVGIYISGQYVQLPVSGQTVVIDLPGLSEAFSPSDTIEGFQILATKADATISSEVGSITVGDDYTFRALEEELGLIREVAMQVGISPDFIVDQLLGSDQVTIGGLLEHYALGKALGEALGYELQDSYTFERDLTDSQGGGETIYITLRLQ